MSDSLGLFDAGARYSLDELVEVANRLLPRFLPQERHGSKLRVEVNPRLVRHLSTLGLLDEAGREGREARYEHRHLLQLLVARRLMAQGYSTGAIKKLTRGARDDELEALLQGGAQLTVSSPLPATTREFDSLEADASRDDLAFASPESRAASQTARRAATAPSSAKSDNAALNFLENIRSGRKAKNDSTVSGAASARPNPISPPVSSAPVSPSQVSGPQVEAPRYVRISVRRGLEIHVGDEFELPPSINERETLMDDVLRELKALHTGKGGRKRR